MKMSYAWAMPNKWTFDIPPILAFVDKYVGDGYDWVDPFAGQSVIAEYRNDIAETHTDALVYLNQCTQPTNFVGALFDPPYSLRQVKESYDKLGIKDWQENNKTGGYPKVKDKLAESVKLGGHVLSFGWNSNGMGKNRGFEKVELLVVAHGGNHHDTLCLAERKISNVIKGE